MPALASFPLDFLLQLQLDADSPMEAKGTALSQYPWQEWLEDWCYLCRDTLPPASSYAVSFLFTDDTTIQGYNAQFRHQDKPTDVLAFATLETGLPGNIIADEPLHLGDLIISLEQANRQALAGNHRLEMEVIWLAAHGFLHLLGWDHPDEASLLTMFSQQNLLLKHIGIKPLPWS